MLFWNVLNIAYEQGVKKSFLEKKGKWGERGCDFSYQGFAVAKHLYQVLILKIVFSWLPVGSLQTNIQGSCISFLVRGCASFTEEVLLTSVNYNNPHWAILKIKLFTNIKAELVSRTQYIYNILSTL